MLETRDMVKIIKADEELMFDIESEPKPLKGYKLAEPHIKLGKGK